MKRFTAVSLAALMALTMILSVIPASAATVGSVEVRGPVYNGTDLTAIFASSSDGSDSAVAYYLEMNSSNFAGFYYDIDEDISTEVLKIYNASTATGDLISGTNGILEDGLVYNTTIANVDYDSSNLGGTYPVIGLFAENYVPVKDDDAGKLAKLLIDDNTKYTMRTGEAIDLVGGFSLTAKQIDVEGDKVWMELSKDGEFVEDEVIDVTSGEANWTYERDGVGGEDDVVVFIVHVTDVFQGQVDSLCVVKGMWLMDYTDIREIETSDEFGELEVDSVGTSLVLKNSGTITLTQDSTQDIAEGLSFKVADDDNDYVRFYLMKEYTEPGTYEVRGTVATGAGAQSWDYSSFAGFFYDLDENVQTESLTINGLNTRTIEEDDLIYASTIEDVSYDSSNLGGTYQVMGFFAEKFVPIKDDDAGKLAKLLIDDNTKHTMRTGEAIDLVGGFALTAKQIDVEGDKVWMELSKDGEFVEDEVIDVTSGAANWTYEKDGVAGEDDVNVFIVHVTDVFQGQVDSLCVVKGMWLIDYEDIMEIESSDEFGEMEVVSVGDGISLNNSGSITLTADSTQDIAANMKFSVADNTTVRYYPFVEYTIGGEVPTATATPKPTATATEAPAATEAPEATEGPAATATPAATAAPTAVETEAPVVTEPPEEEPGFEAIFAIAGLLAVAYLVRRD